MDRNKGYLCENCGKSSAKYEARFIKEGKNLLVCFNCLKELSSVKADPNLPPEKNGMYSWPSGEVSKESPYKQEVNPYHFD